MIIHPPRLIQVGSEIQISSEIELEGTKPRNLWFRFPHRFLPLVSTDSDPFLVALILLAMQKREPLQVRGSISRKLFEGLQAYQEVYQTWFPERFHRIEIVPDHLREDPPTATSQVACAFSGGVDSFYTLVDLLQASPPQKLIHVVFMGGFDMPLNLKASIADLKESFSIMMKNLGIELIHGSTNVRSFVNTVDWTNAHGQALAATALFFKKEWECFFIPSSYTGKTYPKWGTHPSLDPLLSTESMKFVHHGAHANRVNKLVTLSKFPESHSRLRVCWIQDIGLRNCGECEKCVRTMAALDILDSLHYYTTFNSNTKPLGKKIRSLPQRTYQARLFAKELIREAVHRRKYRRAVDLGFSLANRELFYFANRFIRFLQ